MAPILRHLFAASWSNPIAEMRYRSSNHTSLVAPYGLVRKGTRWYLIGQTHNDVRTYRVSRIHDLTISEATFIRPTDFDLAAYWRETQTEYAERFGSYPVRLRIRGEALARASWAYARRKTLGEPDADGWVEAEFDTEDWDGAIGLVGSLGADVIVHTPERLRRQAIANAARLLALNR